MKTSLALATTLLSFLLLACFGVKPSISEPLIDIHGNEVESSLPYFVVPPHVIIGRAGGLGLHRGRQGDCPLDVIQYMDIRNGSKIKFSPADNSAIVQESADLNVIFDIYLLSPNEQCHEPLLFKVDNYDSSFGKWFITTGGVYGQPGYNSLQNWFKVEKAARGVYKFVYCPSVCDSCVKLCSNVGSFFADGALRLGLVPDDAQAFPFVLIPAKELGSSILS